MSFGSNSDMENEKKIEGRIPIECGEVDTSQSRSVFEVGKNVLLNISRVLFADSEQNGFHDNSRIQNTKKLIESKVDRVFSGGTLMTLHNNRLAIRIIAPNQSDTVRILQMDNNERMTIGSFLAPSRDMKWAENDDLLVIIDSRGNIYAFRILPDNVIDLYLRMENGKFINPKNMELYTNFEDNKFICTMACSHNSTLEIYFMDVIHFALYIPDTKYEDIKKIDKSHLYHKMECEITALKFGKDGKTILVGLLSGVIKVFYISDNTMLSLIESISVCNTGSVCGFFYLDYSGPEGVKLCDHVLVVAHHGTKLCIYNIVSWKLVASIRFNTTKSNYKLEVSKPNDESNLVFITDPISKSMFAVEILGIPTNPRFGSVTAVYLPYPVIALTPVSIIPKDGNNDLSYSNDTDLSDDEDEIPETTPVMCKFFALSKRLVSEIDIEFDLSIERTCSTDSRESSSRESYASETEKSITPCPSGTGMVSSFHGEEQRIIDSLEKTVIDDGNNKIKVDSSSTIPPQLASIFSSAENYMDKCARNTIKKSLSPNEPSQDNDEQEEDYEEEEPSTKSSPLTLSGAEPDSLNELLSALNLRMDKIENNIKDMKSTVKNIISEAIGELERNIITSVDENIQSNLVLFTNDFMEQQNARQSNDICDRKMIEHLITSTIQRCTKEMETKFEKMINDQYSRMAYNSNHVINYRNLYKEDTPILSKDTSTLFDNFNNGGKDLFDQGSTTRSLASGGGRGSNLDGEQSDETITRYLNQKAIGNVIDMIPSNTTLCAVNLLVTKYKASDVYEQFKTQLNSHRVMNLICGCAKDLYIHTEEKLSYIENSLIHLEEYVDENSKEMVTSGINYVLSKLPENGGLYEDIHQKYSQEILMIKHRCSEFLELYSNDD
uniref:Ge1_WD40 domain-containing protein n=1 Tax=Parastrongyloides trichosuri TaxID=131310 RepID=A0A0N5A1W5_PARTI